MSMGASWAKNFLESSRTVWVISAVIVCLFALTNLPWQLDDYDQGAASVYFVRDDHGRPLVLSADRVCKSDCAKTTPRWLGFSCDLRDHAVVGYCVAASFVPGGSGTRGHLVPRGDCRLRSGCSVDRLGCLW